MRLAIITAIYKRHALTRHVLEYYRDLTRGFDIKLICAGSEGEESRKLAEGSGWHYVEHENRPLSQKFNAAVRAAYDFNPMAVLMTGSDDLHSGRYIDTAMKIDPTIAQMVGLRDLYFYDIRTGECLRHKGFIGSRASCSIGAGRILTREALDRLEWKPWGGDTFNRGLDLNLSAILRKKHIPEYCRPMSEMGISVDLKSDVNLTIMETFYFNGEQMDPSVLMSTFGETINKIRASWQPSS